MRGIGIMLAALCLAPAAGAQTAGHAGDGGPSSKQSRGMVLDRVVAVVNDEAITLSEVQEEGQPVVRKIFQDFVGPERDRRVEEAEKRLMEDLIDRRLMYQVAKREGTVPSQAEINGAIDELKRSNNVTDDAQFRVMLKAEGLTLEQIRRSIGERLAIGRLLARQIRSAIIVNEDEMVSYYQANQEKYKQVPQAEIRHMLVAAPRGGDEAAARARAEEARVKLLAGADFAQVAAQYLDAAAAARAAEVITVHRGDLAPEIEAAAFGLPAGGVSPLIQAEGGWHLIKVERVQADPVARYAEVREAIRDHLFQEKFEAKRKEWLAGLRSRAFIQVLMPPSELTSQSAKP